VTILQQCVRVADLPGLYAAVAGVFKKTNVLGWKLKAYKYYYIPADPVGLAGIVVEPTPDLLRLQQDVIDALKEAPQRGWTVVSMKDDWNTIFLFEEARPKDRTSIAVEC
jgi:hypothetical protein